MIDTLQAIIGEALGRLSQQVRAGAPAILAGLIILISAMLLARFGRWVIKRSLGRGTLDARVRRSGITAIIDPNGRLRASRVLAEGTYWAILVAGLLGALNAFGTQTGAFVVDHLVALLPRLGTGALIVLAGIWLGLYLGRSTLIWAVNEDLPSPRKLAWAVRAMVIFAAGVAAADTLQIAGSLFRTVFIVILAGVVLAASLAVGLGTRDIVRRYLDQRMTAERDPEHNCAGESLWNHL